MHLPTTVSHMSPKTHTAGITCRPALQRSHRGRSLGEDTSRDPLRFLAVCTPVGNARITGGAPQGDFVQI